MKGVAIAFVIETRSSERKLCQYPDQNRKEETIGKCKKLNNWNHFFFKFKTILEPLLESNNGFTKVTVQMCQVMSIPRSKLSRAISHRMSED